MTRESPLVLTLKLDDQSFAHFEALRQAYFPPHLNRVPAHISLFHHLPGSEIESITTELTEVSQNTAPFSMRVTGLRFLGRGVAYLLKSEPAASFHSRLAHAWVNWLTPQDRQRFSPHITIQNKSDAEDARLLYQQLQASFAPSDVVVTGCDLWHYLGGPWELSNTFNFSPTKNITHQTP